MRKFKLPKSVNICGKTYKVKAFKDSTKLDPESNRFLRGLCLPKNQEIRIHTEVEPEDMLDTFLHEIIHAIFFEMLGLSETIPENQKEVFTSDFATVLADTLVRNLLMQP